jgi:hypothetical protein
MGSINFLVTVANMRAQGMTLYRLPLFVWSLCFVSILLIGSLPVFAAGLTMLLTDRNFNTSFFLPAGGGDVVLYQHLFWFFGRNIIRFLFLIGVLSARRKTKLVFFSDRSANSRAAEENRTSSARPQQSGGQNGTEMWPFDQVIDH